MTPRFYLIIIFLLATIFIGFFLVWPKYQEIAVVRLEIEEAEASIQQEEEYFSNLRNLSERLNQYQDQFSVIESTLPGKFYLPHLFDFLQKTCSQNGLVLQEISSSVSSLGDTRIQEIHVSLRVLGSYSAFKDLLSSLESSVRLFGIESISFSSSEEGEPFAFSLEIKTHSY